MLSCGRKDERKREKKETGRAEEGLSSVSSRRLRVSERTDTDNRKAVGKKKKKKEKKRG